MHIEKEILCLSLEILAQELRQDYNKSNEPVTEETINHIISRLRSDCWMLPSKPKLTVLQGGRSGNPMTSPDKSA